jgi:hypothetical protein
VADIVLTTANRVRVVRSDEQFTVVANVAITAGQAVAIDPTTGKGILADASAAGTARTYGLATKTVPAGLAVTLLRRGLMDGFNFTSQAYDKAIHLSDTAGALADAAGTAPDVIGRVVPAMATTLGTAYDKILSVEL